MQITVDTEKDSNEDIRKIVSLLSSLTDKNISRIGKLDLTQVSSKKEDDEAADKILSVFAAASSSAKPVKKDEEEEDLEEDTEMDDSVQVVPY